MKTLIVAFLLVFSFHVFAQQTKAKNEIVIMMDGYRWNEVFNGADSSLLFNKKYISQDSARLMEKYWAKDADTRRKKLMPFVWNVIAKQGQVYGNRNLGNNVNVKNPFWFSYPGRSETYSGFVDTAVNSNEYGNDPNENVFEYINKQKGYNGKVAAFASWDAVAQILNRSRNGMLVNIYNEDVKGPNLTQLQREANTLQHYSIDIFGKGERPDANTYLLGKAYLMANHPRVLHLDFGDNDEFGHEGKYDFYLDAAHDIDMMIKDLWDYLQQDPFYKGQTTLFIFPDHGRGYGDGWTSHGSKTEHSNETYLMALGPDTPPLGEIKTHEQIYQEQFAQTIARALGFTFTANRPVAEAVKSVIKAH